MAEHSSKTAMSCAFHTAVMTRSPFIRFDASSAPSQRNTGDAAHIRRHRKRRRLAFAAVVLGVIAGLLAVNTVIVNDQAAAAVSSSGTVRVGGTALNVREDGAVTAPALVLIHGLGGSIHWWDAVTPVLAKAHYVIRIDLLGHGRSAKPGGNQYSIPHQARLVGDVLTRLGITHAIVIGHSTGGYVATSLAEQRPLLVTALVLIDTGPSMSAYISGGPTGNLLTTPVIGQLIWRLRTDFLLRQAMGSAFSRPGYRIPQRIIDDLSGMTYHALTATSLASDMYIQQEPMPQRLKQVGKPLLVLYGADDHRWHPASYAQYSAVPGARIEAVPGVGHSPMLEDPAGTSSRILAFVNPLEAR